MVALPGMNRAQTFDISRRLLTCVTFDGVSRFGMADIFVGSTESSPLEKTYPTNSSIPFVVGAYISVQPQTAFA